MAASQAPGSLSLGDRPGTGGALPSSMSRSAHSFATRVELEVSSRYLLYLPESHTERDDCPLVVFLHGLGADGSDLIGLAPVLAPHFPEAAFVSPDAPSPCDMAPMGRQWFSLQSREPQDLYSGSEKAREALDAFLDAELERHSLDDSRLALFGFSQGTMMALHTALRRPTPIAGVAGFSGHLVGVEGCLDLHRE